MDAFPIPPRSFSGSTRKVPLSNAFDWISHGWEGFLAAPKQWLGLGLVAYLFFATVDWLAIYALATATGPFRSALGAVLLLGPICLLPLVTAGGLHACRKLERGETTEFADLFWGLGSKRGALMAVGLIYLIGLLSLIGLGYLISGPLAVFLPLLAGFAFLMAIWYMTPLVSFAGLSPLDALTASFFACGRNLGAFVIFGFVMMVLHALAVLPMGLGLLLLLPVVIGSMYASYRDIFTES
jgi:uncharacterized membrane protein